MQRLIATALVLFTLSTAAHAGAEVVDVSFKIEVCASDLETISWKLRKEQGGTAVTKTISESDHADLVDAAATSESAFDTQAATTLGSWYTTLPSSPENPGQEALYVLYGGLEGTCPV